jgi:hypothetical protein
VQGHGNGRNACKIAEEGRCACGKQGRDASNIEVPARLTTNIHYLYIDMLRDTAEERMGGGDIGRCGYTSLRKKTRK